MHLTLFLFLVTQSLTFIWISSIMFFKSYDMGIERYFTANINHINIKLTVPNQTPPLQGSQRRVTIQQNNIKVRHGMFL